MEYIIKQIEKKHYPHVYDFQCRYLDNEPFESFLFRVTRFPDLYIIALNENSLVGICYGSPFEKDNSIMNLDGIAVFLDEDKNYGQLGIGSSMLKCFEDISVEKGFNVIGLGAADDIKVEAFYLKNNYKPIELVIKNDEFVEQARIEISSYSEGVKLKKELYRKYNPREIIFIFSKEL